MKRALFTVGVAAIAVLAVVGGRLVLAGEAANYEFTAVSVTEEQPGVARVSYVVHWTGQGFPGVHVCTTTVFDANGSVIGENVGQMVSLDTGRGAELPVSVVGKPAEAKMSCDSSRLDGTAVDFAFSNAKVVLPPPDLANDYAFLVSFDASSAPGEIVGSSACTLSVSSNSGELIYEETLEYVSLGGGSGDRSIAISRSDVSDQLTDAEIEGASATFTCSPH